MILVDFSHLFYRNFYMNLHDICPKEGEEDKSESFNTNDFEKIEVSEGQYCWLNRGYLMHLLIQNVFSFSKMLGASKSNPAVIAVDNSSWRKKFYLEHRDQFPEYDEEKYKGKRTKDEELPWPEIFGTLNEVLEFLDNHTDFPVISIEGAEADDVIGVMSKKCDREGKPCFIVSSDKDFVQLQSDNVRIYDPVKKEMRPDVDASKYLITHIIMGDKGDNIKAIRPRTGPKTAEKLYYQLDELLKTDPEARKRYEFNKKLIDLDEIPEEIKAKILDRFENVKYDNFDIAEVTKFCTKHRLKKIYDNIQDLKLKEGTFKTSLNTPPKKVDDIAESTIEDFFS